MFRLLKFSPEPWATLFSTVFFLSLLLCLSQPGAAAEKRIGFTAEEQRWLERHPVVRLAPDPDFPPLEFMDGDGVYRGIAADFIKLLEEKLPLRFEIVRLPNWNEVISQAKSRKIDMFGAAVPTPQRLEFMRFTKPYVEFPAVVVVRDSAERFPTLSELKGKRVAVVSNYADHEFMREAHPRIPLEVMPDISSGLRQVSFGKVDAMVLNLASASYYIQKDGISNLKVTEDTDFVFDLSFAARSDWPELISVIEKGMAALTAEEKRAVLNNWISLSKSSWRPSRLLISTSAATGLILILGVFLVWNRSLHLQVRERTKALENELSERLRSEQEKAELQLQVLRAKKMEAIGVLAGGVAHDLNNILAGAVGYSDLVMRKIPKDSNLQHYFREIRESGRRAAAVVADLLTMSRDTVANREIADLNSLVCEYMASAEQRALSLRYPDVEFRVHYAAERLIFSCSPTHFKKSLMNLVINAAEATRKGTVKIHTDGLTLAVPSASSAPGEYVRLSVTDTGAGIADEDLEHIFEPFYTKKKLGHSGTGLGLAVVWNTVREHQGFVEVKCLEQGTRFELNFPASDQNLSVGAAVIDDSELQGRGERILVVDDDVKIRQLALRLLQDLGYRVATASSGEAAVEYLKNHRVDLLILDMLMEPGMNGFETFKAVKAFLPRQKALIASGFSPGQDVQRALRLGIGAYIKKPYTRQELGLAVKNELQHADPI